MTVNFRKSGGSVCEISDEKNLTEVVRVSMETFLRKTIKNDVDID